MDSKNDDYSVDVFCETDSVISLDLDEEPSTDPPTEITPEMDQITWADNKEMVIGNYHEIAYRKIINPTYVATELENLVVKQAERYHANGNKYQKHPTKFLNPFEEGSSTSNSAILHNVLTYKLDKLLHPSGKNEIPPSRTTIDDYPEQRKREWAKIAVAKIEDESEQGIAAAKKCIKIYSQMNEEAKVETETGRLLKETVSKFGY